MSIYMEGIILDTEPQFDHTYRPTLTKHLYYNQIMSLSEGVIMIMTSSALGSHFDYTRKYKLICVY